ncbi:MAG: hypothetical protein ACSHWW_11595 [Nonlabens sp.]|uniref:hypothetical protein n=1 Tax=Nonlabens sp. TaxID=1888209 RepID=UPI003EF9029B
MEINLQNKKLELIQWLVTLEDSSIIQKILELRKKESKDWWDDLSENEKVSIEKGISDSKEGKLNTNSQAEKIYGKWL